jgi:ABC-type lipoprotein release transport system permease subunit
MRQKAKLLISIKYFWENKFKTILASGGVIVGVFCITLCTFVALGVAKKLNTAVNSQPSAKYFQVQKVDTGAKTLFQVNNAPKFVFLGNTEIQSIAQTSPNIVDYAPKTEFNALLETKKTDTSCYSQNQNPDNSFLPEKPAGNDNCYAITLTSGSFENFYQSNKNNWLGSTKKPEKNEVIVCYQCLKSKPLFKKLNINKPNELLGKTIKLEYYSIQNHLESGQIYDVINPPKNLIFWPKDPLTFEIQITAVINDQNSNEITNTNNFFFTSPELQDQAKSINPQNKTIKNPGYQTFDVLVNDYKNLDSSIKTFQDKNLLTTSNTQIIIGAINTLSIVISIVLGFFGIIALIASVFGIVNIILISTLKRGKEIAILKSLGARGKDIFSIFLLEGLILGLVGWFIGTIMGYICGVLISISFEKFILQNPQYAKNLANFGITDFSLDFEPLILLITLLLTIIICVISSIFPALGAAKSDPVKNLNN